MNRKEIEEGPMSEAPIYKVIQKEGIPIWQQKKSKSNEPDIVWNRQMIALMKRSIGGVFRQV